MVKHETWEVENNVVELSEQWLNAMGQQVFLLFRTINHSIIKKLHERR